MSEKDLGALLGCDNCGHGVNMHVGSGCEARGCTCLLTKDELIEGNVRLAIQEHGSQWQPEHGKGTSPSP